MARFIYTNPLPSLGGHLGALPGLVNKIEIVDPGWKRYTGKPDSTKKGTSTTLSLMDLKVAFTGANQCLGTTALSGRTWFDVVVESALGAMPGINLATGLLDNYCGRTGDYGYGYFANDGGIYNNGSILVTYATHAAGDILTIAFDNNAQKVWFAKNSAWQSGNPLDGTGGLPVVPGVYYPVYGIGASNPSLYTGNAISSLGLF